MTLWLFSSDDPDANDAADADLIQNLRRPRPRLSFIASSHDGAAEHFNTFATRFATYGVTECQLFTVDQAFSKRSHQRLLRSDLIYLDGGNTFYFLKHLKTSGVGRDLINFYKSGKSLAGTSAGAIILTRSIKTAGYPEFDRDDNTVGITDWRGLGLARFEFFPHYNGTDLYNAELARQSCEIAHPLYAATDGAAIAVCQDRLTFYGKITGFLRGIRFKIAG